MISLSCEPTMLPEQRDTQTPWFSEVYEPAGTAQSWRLTAARLDARRTPYQHIEIFATESYGRLMSIDGCVMLTSRDNFLYHEMMTHPALFTHGQPRDVVIIGGGDCGTLREVLKHASVRSAVQIDIDEQVTRLAEIYFPELCVSNSDPRARLLFDDGLAWIKHAPDASADSIIIDSTDPIGPAEGLFGPGFVSDCFRVLRSGGLLVQQSESPLIHQPLIKGIRENMRQAGFTDMRTLGFPQPCYPSGWWSATLAVKGDHSLDAFREQDSRARSFETKYYTAACHRGALTEPPFLRKVLQESGL